MTVHEFLSVGPWLVDVASSRRGWSSPFDLTGARGSRREHHEIELTDVVDGSAATTTAGARVEAHLSVLPAHDGQRIAAVVWTQVAPRSLITLRSLVVRDATRHGASSTVAIHPLVIGKIDPHSVQLKGLRVSFTQDGQHRSFKLGA